MPSHANDAVVDAIALRGKGLRSLLVVALRHGLPGLRSAMRVVHGYYVRRVVDVAGGRECDVEFVLTVRPSTCGETARRQETLAERVPSLA